MKSDIKSSTDTSQLRLSSPLSVFVPRRHRRQSPSLTSQSTGESSAAEHLPHSPASPWSNVSLDQISGFARRASSSSISLLNASASAVLHPASLATSLSSLDAEERLHDRTQRVVLGLLMTLKLSLNDRSLSFYRISEHIHRKVPQLVEDKHKLKQLTTDVTTANSDIADARKQVAMLERIESFHRIGNMVSRSITLARQLS